MLPLIPVIGGLIGAIGGIKIMSKLSPKDFKNAKDVINNPGETFEHNRKKINEYFEDSAKDPCVPKDLKNMSNQRK